MSEKVLFVDDERSLLNGIERRLGDDYDIITAESGAEGLIVLQEQGPFPVVFTDMRMPGMDGVEFAKKGQAIAPDSTFIMLTGNQDQTTAVQAVNDGRVFRFLNKPCDFDNLRRALNDGIEQHRLVTAEKELLQKTFTGAVAVLTDVIAMSHTGLAGVGDGIEQRLAYLTTALGMEDRWEYRLASRLSPLGLSLISDQERDVLFRSRQDSDEATDVLMRSLELTGRLVRDIPRLGVISEVCDDARTSTGGVATLHPKKRRQITTVGGTLVRVAIHWEILALQGLRNKECCAEISLVLPELYDGIANGILELGESSPMNYKTEEAVEVPLSQLAPGMVAARDICDSDQNTLIRCGCRLTDAIIAKLANVPSLRPIFVTPATR